MARIINNSWKKFFKRLKPIELDKEALKNFNDAMEKVNIDHKRKQAQSELDAKDMWVG